MIESLNSGGNFVKKEQKVIYFSNWVYELSFHSRKDMNHGGQDWVCFGFDWVCFGLKLGLIGFELALFLKWLRRHKLT